MIQFIGYLAGAILAIALIPQVYKSYTTKSTTDISLGWSIILVIGLSLYLAYGIGIGQMPIIVMNSIEDFLAILVLVAKLIYK
ncbi:MAG TPA: PQ-loop domain-containing transporter [Candidatus Bathyarchaeia archaeon]|nr:PQ-loop domain-containing transporter [Candidatus Bathyarchaeia archaeon]